MARPVLPRPVCARPRCGVRVKQRDRRFCSKRCAALSRGPAFRAARRRGGRAAWLRHGRPAFLARMAALDARPDVVTASSKGEAFSRGITEGTKLMYGAVRRFYVRARGAVPPGLLESLEASSRRLCTMVAHREEP